MRALVLTTDAFGGHGGLAKYNRDFITALCSHPRTTEVVALPRVVSNEIEPLPRGLTFVTDALGGKPKFIAALARQWTRTRPVDVVFCGHINLLAPALATGARFGAPVILWVYGIDVWRRPNRFAPYGCHGIRGFVSISQVTADRFRSWAPLGRKREWIIPNAIELGRFSPGPKSDALLNRYGLHDKTVLLTVARLVSSERMKGVDEVLQVLPDLKAAHPDLVYLVVGGGSDEERLRKKAAALGVTNSVVFAGRIRESEKVEHYRLADVYAMPSRGEGFGFVFLEALACGVPVVASAVDGGKEAVRGGELGVLVDPANSDDVVRGIEEALARPKGIRPVGLSYFAFDKFEARVHAFVDEVVGLGR